jgi:hypothetical protein
MKQPGQQAPGFQSADKKWSSHENTNDGSLELAALRVVGLRAKQAIHMRWP